MWDSDLPLEVEQKRFSTLKKLFIGTLIISISLYVVFPILFKFSASVKSNMTFMNLLKDPSQKNFHNLAKNYGLVGARNFYLTSQDGVSLGVWHTLPSKLQVKGASLDTDDPYNVTVAAQYHEWLQDATVFVYCHGTTFSRAADGRVKLYKVLNRLGYHVITFDYRGYGDSTGHPTSEKDVVLDALTVLNWLRGHVKQGHLFLWGHSLGSGVVSNLLAKLELEADRPIVGAVMESSFTNLLDALRAYPLGKPYAHLPGFNYLVIKPLANQGLKFQNEEYLKNTSVPLLFLHAEDDKIVPFRLGKKLYESVKSSRKNLTTVTFVNYSKDLGYGHHKICDDPKLGAVVAEFVKKSIERKTN